MAWLSIHLVQLLFIVITVLTVNSPAAIASEGSATAGPCPALSIEQRYMGLVSSNSEGKSLNVAITHLLSEAFTPYLKNLYNFIKATPDELIRTLVESVKIYPVNEGMTLRFGSQYDGIHRCEIFPHWGNRIAFTHFNSVSMRRLLKAVCVTGALLKKSEFESIGRDQVLNSSAQLLRQRTFANISLLRHLHFFFVSVLQSATQLTSSPVLNYTDDEILRISMQQKGPKPSLMVLHSLMLPPAVLGPGGDSSYIPDAVISDGNGGLTFAPVYRQFIREQRAEFDTRKHRVFEFGHGCPVGHCLSGEDRPGLQYFLDAILYIYDRIGDDTL